CHSKITPTARFAKPGGAGYGSVFEVVYSCPNSECREFFIAYFSNPDTAGPYRLSGMRPHEPVKLALEESVKAVSPSFCDIYQEAHKAEVLELKQICGMGYRKALESLIKDYLIQNNADRETEIKRMMLGPCIDRFVTDHKIKDVAKRAV